MSEQREAETRPCKLIVLRLKALVGHRVQANAIFPRSVSWSPGGYSTDTYQQDRSIPNLAI